MNPTQLRALVDEATMDCYDEDEQVMGLYTMIQDNLDLPFETMVVGVGVTVDSVDLTGRAASWRSALEASSGRRSRSSIFRCRRPHQTARRGSTPTATGPTGPRPNPAMAGRDEPKPG